jgi:heat shock protein HtpX
LRSATILHLEPRVVFARLGPLATANFVLLLILGAAYRALVSTGLPPMGPNASRAVQAGLFANGPDTIAWAIAIHLGFLGAFVAVAFSKTLSRRLFGARLVKTAASAEEAWLLRMVRSQAERARMGVPEVAIRKSARTSIVATGMSCDHMLLTFSTGALRGLDRGELERAVARELSHVARGQMVTFALIQGALNAFVVFFAGR